MQSAVRIAHKVPFIEHWDNRAVAAAEALQNFICHVQVRARFGAGSIAHVQNDVRRCSLLQRGAKRLHQMVRQAAHKADRIDEHNGLAAGQLQRARRGVQRREKLILRQNARLRQEIHQGRFARVRVADKCHRHRAVLFAAALRLVAADFYFLQLLAQRFNSAANVSAVGLQLRFARAARADAAAETRKRRAFAGQTRQKVFQLRRFHLHLTCAALRTLRKNIEDQHRAVHNAHVRRIFKVADLRRRQLAVKNNQLNLVVLTEIPNFLHHTAAYTRRGLRGGALLHHRRNRLRAAAFCKLPQLAQRFLRVILARVQRDQKCALRHDYVFRIIHKVLLFSFLIYRFKAAAFSAAQLVFSFLIIQKTARKTTCFYEKQTHTA